MGGKIPERSISSALSCQPSVVSQHNAPLAYQCAANIRSSLTSHLVRQFSLSSLVILSNPGILPVHLPAWTILPSRRIHFHPELIFIPDEEFLEQYRLLILPRRFAPDHSALAPTGIRERLPHVPREVEELVMCPALRQIRRSSQSPVLIQSHQQILSLARQRRRTRNPILDAHPTHISGRNQKPR